jgi:hypothetical protein
LAALGCSAAPEDPGADERAESLLNASIDAETSSVVSIVLDRDGLTVDHCTGSLLTPTLVLTAAHCLAEPDLGSSAVGACDGEDAVGEEALPTLLVSTATQTPRETESGFVRVVQALRAPPLTRDDGICARDVALLRLEMEVASPALVPRIDLPARAGEVFAAVGFGLADIGGTSSAGVRRRSPGNSVLCSGQGCAGIDSEVAATEWLSADVRACTGDSGGPAFDAEGRVIGVASRGYADCSGVIYTDVAHFGGFVREVVLAEASLRGYDAPGWSFASAGEAAPGAGGEAAACATRRLRAPGSRAVGLWLLVAFGTVRFCRRNCKAESGRVRT